MPLYLAEISQGDYKALTMGKTDSEDIDGVIKEKCQTQQYRKIVVLESNIPSNKVKSILIQNIKSKGVQYHSCDWFTKRIATHRHTSYYFHKDLSTVYNEIINFHQLNARTTILKTNDAKYVQSQQSQIIIENKNADSKSRDSKNMDIKYLDNKEFNVSYKNKENFRLHAETKHQLTELTGLVKNLQEQNNILMQELIILRRQQIPDQ